MRGFSAVGLYNSKDALNVGSVLRAAGCFGASFVVVSGNRYKTAKTDTMKAFRHLPFFQVEDLFMMLPLGCVPVAVELRDDALFLEAYTHPERAFYIFGPEDGSLPDDIVKKCGHVVRINSRRCLNLAASVNVVLYDRQMKALRNR